MRLNKISEYLTESQAFSEIAIKRPISAAVTGTGNSAVFRHAVLCTELPEFERVSTVLAAWTGQNNQRGSLWRPNGPHQPLRRLDAIGQAVRDDAQLIFQNAEPGLLLFNKRGAGCDALSDQDRLFRLRSFVSSLTPRL
jgi:hypothetical protein